MDKKYIEFEENFNGNELSDTDSEISNKSDTEDDDYISDTVENIENLIGSIKENIIGLNNYNIISKKVNSKFLHKLERLFEEIKEEVYKND